MNHTSNRFYIKPTTKKAARAISFFSVSNFMSCRIYLNCLWPRNRIFPSRFREFYISFDMLINLIPGKAFKRAFFWSMKSILQDGLKSISNEGVQSLGTSFLLWSHKHILPLPCVVKLNCSLHAVFLLCKIWKTENRKTAH